MAKQKINQGTSPTGAGGDTFRTGSAKLQANDDEIYNYLGDGTNLNKLGTAASKNVGTAAGNVMEVGVLGWCSKNSPALGALTLANLESKLSGLYTENTTYGQALVMRGVPGYGGLLGARQDGHLLVQGWGSNGLTPIYTVLSDKNTVVDSNGFIKKASPIVKLFAEKIEPNEEALEQEPIFEKVDVGHYLIKNTEGFSDDGWYIEMPKDANGNVLVAVQYQQLEDNTIEVKTFAKKFDEETGDILPNLEKPRDIPEDRWIDIRLKELPKPEIEISNTPVDFQPTNLAQAVAEALKNDSEQ